MTPCGPNNNFYSAAGIGMGLVTEAIMVELGKFTNIVKRDSKHSKTQTHRLRIGGGQKY